MAGSSADTPATPEFFRASDAERDHAIDELRNEFVEGRLSHETFVYRMQTALDARDRSQLAGLFTDLPPRPTRLLARIRASLRGFLAGGRNQPRAGPAVDPRTVRNPTAQGVHGRPQAPGPAWAQRSHESRGAVPTAEPRWLAGVAGEHAGVASLVFPPGPGSCFSIGRTPDCDLRLADLSVSRHHAQLSRAEDGWLLSDAGSHNGTRLNGWRVTEPVPVQAGDVVQFGSATFVLRGGPQAEGDRQLPGEGRRTG